MTKAIAFTGADQCLHSRFDKIAALLPDRPAVSDENRSLTYLELQQASNIMARRVLDLLGEESGNIAFFIDNNVFQVITILGIMKAGRSYVALDTSFPAERNLAILEDASCELLISTEDKSEEAGKLAKNIRLEYADRLNDELPSGLPDIEIEPGRNAITLYTSGSTGKPKGVLQSHRNMVHFIKRMSDQLGIFPTDKVAYYLSVGFSAHALPLFGALLNGAELKTYNFTSGNFFGFNQWFKASNISFAMMIPSFLRHFLAAQDIQNSYPMLRILLLGGETLYRSDVEKARLLFEKSTTIVIYASTEAYIMRSFIMKHNTIIRNNVVPIGYPVDGMELLIHDENGNPAGKNVSGEIILKSEFLTEGYHNMPEQQKKDFSYDAENEQVRVFKTSDIGYFLDDDCIVHIGRGDSVVKLRGYRIDLNEIVNILLENKDITEASCLIRETPQGVEHIIAYIVSAGQTEPDLEYCNASLVKMLPAYMIPSHIIIIDEIPKNVVGKTDQKKLPEPEWQSGSSKETNAPFNETETLLVEIFEKMLKINPIGTNDNFLKLGANSLSLFVAFTEVEKKFGVKLDINAIVQTPDIKSIAAFIDQKEPS